jgi:predicted RND superfamily exporter protein
MFNAYTRFVIKRPVIVLVGFALVTIFLASGIFKLQFDTSIEAFLPKQDSEYKYYHKVKEIYGDIDTFVILSISHEKLWSLGTFREIDQLLTDLEEYQSYNSKKETQRLQQLEVFLSRKDLK